MHRKVVKAFRRNELSDLGRLVEKGTSQCRKWDPRHAYASCLIVVAVRCLWKSSHLRWFWLM